MNRQSCKWSVCLWSKPSCSLLEIIVCFDSSFLGFKLNAFVRNIGPRRKFTKCSSMELSSEPPSLLFHAFMSWLSNSLTLHLHAVFGLPYHIHCPPLYTLLYDGVLQGRGRKLSNGSCVWNHRLGHIPCFFLLIVCTDPPNSFFTLHLLIVLGPRFLYSFTLHDTACFTMQY